VAEETKCAPACAAAERPMTRFFADGTKFIEPIACVKCQEHAYLIRRAPDPDIPGNEIHTFQCPACGHQIEQSVTL
jgi:hypothetical protein